MKTERRYITTLRGNSHDRRKMFRAIKRKHPTAAKITFAVYATVSAP